MRRWIRRNGGNWHLERTDGELACGERLARDASIERMTDADEAIPPFACAPCLLSERPPAAGPGRALPYDPLRLD
jgi:hypothetical protein